MADKTVAFRPFDGLNFSITGSESDAGVVGELERSGGHYQRDLAALLARLLPPDAVVADVGAHIGVVSVLAAGLCPRGHVFAFEPVAENHAHLVANVAANGLANVTVERVAVFDHDGEVSLEYDAASPGGSHVVNAGAKVRAVRFDTWARERGLARLDLVKLDVEGVELAVLDGAADTLRRLRPTLVVECNPIALARFGDAGYGDLLRCLRSLFASVGVIGPEGGSGGSVTPIVSAAQLRMILGRRGVVDLIARPSASWRQRSAERAVGWVSTARLLRAAQRRRAPEEAFVIDPGGITLAPAVGALTGAAGQRLRVPLDVHNGSASWLSSGFPHHPVTVSGRWLDDTGGLAGIPEGQRSGFPAPLRPGGSARFDATVELPAAPGSYTLVFTLVQERFAWLDEVDPACAARLPVTVTVTAGAGPPAEGGGAP